MLLLTAAKHLQEISSSAAPSMIWIYHPHLPAYGSGLNQSPHLFFPGPARSEAVTGRESCFRELLPVCPRLEPSPRSLAGVAANGAPVKRFPVVQGGTIQRLARIRN